MLLRGVSKTPLAAAAVMGCGPSSFANEQQAQLVWATKPGDCDACCGGPLARPKNLPSWLTQADLDTIYRIGTPWGAIICCQADCCGVPCCTSPYAHNGPNVPLQALREALPYLSFSFSAQWVGCGDSANWKHMLTIAPGGGPPVHWGVAPPAIVAATMPAAGVAGIAPVVAAPVGGFVVTVPAGVKPGQQLQVSAPSGQPMMVVVPDGVDAGMQFMAQA